MERHDYASALVVNKQHGADNDVDNDVNSELYSDIYSIADSDEFDVMNIPTWASRKRTIG